MSNDIVIFRKVEVMGEPFYDKNMAVALRDALKGYGHAATCPEILHAKVIA